MYLPDQVTPGGPASLAQQALYADGMRGSTMIEAGPTLGAHLGPRLELPLRTESVQAGKVARDTARLYLASWMVNDDIAQAVLQVIAELLGNVVRHTDSAYVLIVMCRLHDRVRVEVADFGRPRVPGTAPVVHEAGDDEEDRRGLALVEYFSVKAGDFPNERGLTRFSEIALAA